MADSRQPLLAWPRAKDLAETLGLSLAFSLLFLSIYGGASWLTGLRQARYRVHMDWELSVPFVLPMAAVYLSLNLLLGLAPWILRTRREYLPLFWTMAAQLAAGGLVFLLFPVASAFPEHAAAGLWGGLFRVADALNLEHNMLPSLHVAFAFTAAEAFGRRCGAPGRGAFRAWAAAIALSTLLTHQHYLADIAAGLLWAWAGMRFIYPRLDERRRLTR